jgi:hypothetical protein
MIALHVLCASISSETDIITGWRLASSADLGSASGAVISRGQYDDSQWQQLQHFPTTVLAALAANGSAPHANFSLPLSFRYASSSAWRWRKKLGSNRRR